MMKNIAALAASALIAVGGMAFAHDGPHINDAQIAHIAYTAGVIDAEAARQALAKSKNKEVRAFAETMVRDHEAVNGQALALVKKLGVAPEANATSTALGAEAKAIAHRLASLDAGAFDRAYVRNEIAFHAKVNGALATSLIPGAKNAELKSLLETGLALFKAHQMHAEHLSARLR